MNIEFDEQKTHTHTYIQKEKTGHRIDRDNRVICAARIKR